MIFSARYSYLQVVRENWYVIILISQFSENPTEVNRNREKRGGGCLVKC